MRPKKVILCVDDNEQALSVRKFLLETRGYRVIPATDGAMAIEILQQGGIAMVVSDLVMPQMDGIATIRAIKALDRGAKLMIVSGLVSRSQAEIARSEGVEEFVAKPFTTDELLRTLRRVLSS